VRGDVLAKCRVSGSNTSNQPDAPSKVGWERRQRSAGGRQDRPRSAASGTRAACPRSGFLPSKSTIHDERSTADYEGLVLIVSPKAHSVMCQIFWDR